jgi:hypothetical protein
MHRSIFLVCLISPELNRQPAFKLCMNQNLLLIYRLIPRTHGLLSIFKMSELEISIGLSMGLQA